MKKINIVTAVERTPLVNLQGMIRISKSEVRLPANVNWQPVDMKPHAQLTIADKVESKNTIWVAKLVFKTCQGVESGRQWAFRCRLSDGRYRLLGTNERPYPMVTTQENMPENITENQLDEVTVNWQSTHLIPIIAE